MSGADLRESFFLLLAPRAARSEVGIVLERAAI